MIGKIKAALTRSNVKLFTRIGINSLYAVVYFDAVHFKVREDGAVETKAVYSCYGITSEGEREIPGLWIGESEGAKFWFGVCADLQKEPFQQ